MKNLLITLAVIAAALTPAMAFVDPDLAGHADAAAGTWFPGGARAASTVAGEAWGLLIATEVVCAPRRRETRSNRQHPEERERARAAA